MSKQFFVFSPQSIYCQGDIISFEAEFPFITDEGDIAVNEEPHSYWLIIGNTCDLSRDVDSEPYSNIIPLQEIKPSIPADALNSLKKYIPYKKHFIPTWDEELTPIGFVADFTKTCTIEKKVFISDTSIKIKEMTQLSWFLLHSCLVRYLARDDGRHD
ncbi:MAG: hypothetical protein GY804_00595 [Alphaproteobacteria bacterium]|nr:hypothetical protein [Alphaproteobacteria bacterium]